MWLAPASCMGDDLHPLKPVEIDVWDFLTWPAAVAALIWFGLLFDSARRWDFRPVDEDQSPTPPPSCWPEVVILVPARNEAVNLPETLPALLDQDYPGPFHLYLIDDRSTDGTAALAKTLDHRGNLVVLHNTEQPAGWTGKVSALEHGLRVALDRHDPAFIFCTDADIAHRPDSLSRLVAQSLDLKLGCNSRMARLRCETFAERLCIPAFVYFFNLLYPMRWINDPQKRTYGAAGGSVLLSRQALHDLGDSFASIRDCLIDDVNLARAVQATGHRLRLELSASRVASLRGYPDLESVAAMVRRSAYAQLGYRLWLGALTLLGLVWLFALPPLALLIGIVIGHGALASAGGAAWFAMSLSYRPAIRFFGLPIWRTVLLPIAGWLYGWMTWQSIWRHHRGRPVVWRESAGD